VISLSTIISKLFSPSHSSVIFCLLLFQSEIFGTLSKENEVDMQVLQEESDFGRLKAQRAAKRARLA
jgi:hypothetical protein